MKKVLLIIFFAINFVNHLLAQDNGNGIYIDPNRSDPNARRSLILSANQVESFVGNWGNIGQGDIPISGVWPRGTGHDHIHELTGIIGASVVDTNGTRIVIISDGFRDGGGTSGELDPITNIGWKFHPLPGYVNLAQGQDEFANSLNSRSWPDTWPGKDATWNGLWNGFFGLHQFNADQEAFYMMDDTFNKEFQFFPIDGDFERQGLGMQVGTRLFQWTHPLAKDILFIYYEVTNIGDHDYDATESPIYFGVYGDVGLGGRGTVDDDSAFRDDLDLVYGWDHDNRGVWSRNREIPPGYMGWKFLESPGISDDGRDNDMDGLLDERRDNPAGNLVFGPVGIYGDPKEHFEGDEDGDWNSVVGDVGSDGIGPLDEGYPGPDSDGTENNGVPDQGEPDFGKLDNDESDQVGLTSFDAPPFATVLVSDEEALWQRIEAGNFKLNVTQAINQYWIFGSGPFNLPSKNTERFSTAVLFAPDELGLFQTAGVAQRIFDSDYRFAKPPKQPTLTATPSDGKVILTWDNIAEFSRDPVYGSDFEGYRIYRSTDPQFLDAEDITDARGNAVFRKPIAQFDIANGLTGPHPLQFGEEIDQPTGIHYYMGDDTGLQHYFIDDDVINGRTYFYAVTSYDTGYDEDFFQRNLSDFEFLFPITPSESPAAIIVNEGIITRRDRNTAIATPNPLPSNVIDGVLQQVEHAEGLATGSVEAELVVTDFLETGDFTVTFETEQSGSAVEYETITFSVFNETSGEFAAENERILLNYADGKPIRNWAFEALDKGFVLNFKNQFPTKAFARDNSGWEGEVETNILTLVEPLFESSPVEPISFVVEVGEVGAIEDSAFTSTTGRISKPVNFKVYQLGSNEPIDFVFFEARSSDDGEIDADEIIYIVFKPTPTARRFTSSWSIKFNRPLDLDGNEFPDEQIIVPKAGDKFIVRNMIPFEEGDVFTFSTTAKQVLSSPGEGVLADVRVVPNPYIVSSILEQQPFLSGRGERFVRFINLPSQCTVRIYTVNGDLVQTLEHDGLDKGAIRWDLRSKDGLEVAFGLYVYHVDAPGIGEKVDKFAIIN